MKAAPMQVGGDHKVPQFATLAPMFIHRTAITGLSDRGAWPWRTPVPVRS